MRFDITFGAYHLSLSSRSLHTSYVPAIFRASVTAFEDATRTQQPVGFSSHSRISRLRANVGRGIVCEWCVCVCVMHTHVRVLCTCRGKQRERASRGKRGGKEEANRRRVTDALFYLKADRYASMDNAATRASNFRTIQLRIVKSLFALYRPIS